MYWVLLWCRRAVAWRVWCVCYCVFVLNDKQRLSLIAPRAMPLTDCTDQTFLGVLLQTYCQPLLIYQALIPHFTRMSRITNSASFGSPRPACTPIFCCPPPTGPGLQSILSTSITAQTITKTTCPWSSPTLSNTVAAPVLLVLIPPFQLR